MKGRAKAGLPIDPDGSSNLVGEGVAMSSGCICTYEVGDTVDVKSISPS